MWERNKDKDVSIKELAYVAFMTDYKSPFSSIVDETDRDREVRSALAIDKTWKVDAVIQDACKMYESLQDTITLKFLRSARRGLAEVEKFLNTVDLSDRDKMGKLVIDPSKITSMLKDAGNISQSLKKLEEETRKEIEIKDSSRGGRSLGMYEK